MSAENQYTDNDALYETIGAEIAATMQCKRDSEHRDRWQTTVGTKTNIGLALSVIAIIDSHKAESAPRPELSFDGCGINGPDEYRTRLATFNWKAAGTSEVIKRYGNLFAAAPELLSALKMFVAQYEGNGRDDREQRPEMIAARAAIAKAEGLK